MSTSVKASIELILSAKTLERARCDETFRALAVEKTLTDDAYLCGSSFITQARAFLGFGESKEAAYSTDTKAIIEQVKATLEMAPGTEGREESINKTRTMTNAWVAKYRRDNATTGKPSYGQVYSALNAVSGHFNNFGTKYPFPAKRRDRVFDEFKSAELLLERGR